MENQLSLKDMYEQILEQTKNDLLDFYHESISVNTDHLLNKNFKLVLSLKRVILGKHVTFLICFPECFPDYFPDIFVDTNNGNPPRIPHIDNRGFICTVDKESCSPNTQLPTEFVFKIIEKAINIYRDGIRGKNASDFREEFLAYWGLDVQPNVTIKSMFIPTDVPKELFYVYRMKERLLEGFIFETEEDFEKSTFLKNDNNDEFKKRQILYIPFNNFDFHPLSSQISEVVKALSANDFPGIKAQMNRIYKLEDEHHLFVSSIQQNGSYAVFAWKPHYNPNMTLAGFRKGKIPFYLGTFQAKNRMLKYNVERIDQARLFQRIGADIDSIFDKKLLIAGCGSIGSHLSMALAKSGISKFVFMDKETLSIENIARHLCGYAFVPLQKTKAVKMLLELHFPYLRCTAHDADILSILTENPEFLNEMDLSIIAVGKTQIELRFDQYCQGNTLYLWVEPFGVAGHAVFIPAHSKTRLQDFYDESFKYKLTVIENSSEYYKKEAGCQSTFLPYSFAYIETFISVITVEIIKLLKNPTDSPKAFVWIGNLDEFNNLNLDINSCYKKKKYELVEFQGKELEDILNGDNFRQTSLPKDQKNESQKL